LSKWAFSAELDRSRLAGRAERTNQIKQAARSIWLSRPRLA